MAGKRPYVVSVGEITPEKLGNFPNIEAWVLVSCGYHPFFDNSNFYRPIITPMECYIALFQPEAYSLTTHIDKFLNLELNDNKDLCIVQNESTKTNHLIKDQLSWEGIELNHESLSPSILVQGQHGTAEMYNTEPSASNFEIS
ncbi:Diphthamide biosynthesis protein 2 [Thelohanellus kitauei]|uniref:Diphthamide biosynthesis protein 2 n=1 Tax=Thelohanellus kitauei TaxID=669202 RepID=A0A0C2MAV5_THEKT|nr:Diphthamide biosynthesis protein 2 [Thelohanellus kitauei]